MTQVTGLLETGAKVAADIHATTLRDFAAAQAGASPLRDLFTPKLIDWIEDRLKAGKSVDLYAALQTAKLDAAAKAHANARLLQERDAALNKIAELNMQRAALFRLQIGSTVYLLEDRDSEVTAALNNDAWRGVLTFGVYSPVVSASALVSALETLVKQGFGGRVVGNPVGVQAVSVKRIAPGEADKAQAVVRLEYLATRRRVTGRAETIDGGYTIREATL